MRRSVGESWRTSTPPAEYPYSRVLDEIAQAGYSGTELGPYGFLPTDSTKLRGELEKRSLTLCSGFIEMDLGNAAKLEGGLRLFLRPRIAWNSRVAAIPPERRDGSPNSGYCPNPISEADDDSSKLSASFRVGS